MVDFKKRHSDGQAFVSDKKPSGVSKDSMEHNEGQPKNTPKKDLKFESDSIKICSRCDKRFDIDKSKHGHKLGDLPLCNACYDKGLKPLGHPPHWIWNKMSHKEKIDAVNDVNHSGFNVADVSEDFEDLPKPLRNRLRHKWGIENE